MSEAAQQPSTDRGSSHQMPLHVVAALRPGGGGGSRAKPWGSETVGQMEPRAPRAGKATEGLGGDGSIREQVLTGAGGGEGCGGHGQGVGTLLTLSQCRVCAQEDRCPLAVAAAAGWLCALMTHSMPKRGFPHWAPQATAWGIPVMSSEQLPRRAWQ